MTLMSGYRLMWMLVMFDLPVGTQEERKSAHDFRMQLLDEGFAMAQFSVYLRYCTGQAFADALVRRVIAGLPDGGKVDVLIFTDKQYEKMQTFEQGRRCVARKNPEQFVLL